MASERGNITSSHVIAICASECLCTGSGHCGVSVRGVWRLGTIGACRVERPAVVGAPEGARASRGRVRGRLCLAKVHGWHVPWRAVGCSGWFSW